MSIASKARRLFVGDLHGCLAELDGLLAEFAFRPGKDCLFSVGDVIGKGPDVVGTLRRLRDLDAGVVVGNHDFSLLEAARQSAAGQEPKHRDYLESLGRDKVEWVDWISTWPLYLESPDVLLVHAGLDPGKKSPARMDPRILTQIRTWDGKGENLNRAGDPPWFECVKSDRIVVFGHWAQRGLIDLPGFKGLDTGCVYGGKLTGWCPEENRFLQVPAKRAYAPIHFH
ncbi:MAG: metallophosphoesterase [Fibrobacteres bacterium]|nr:metallophosphoesterase [Fibrobacterota bacterium]